MEKRILQEVERAEKLLIGVGEEFEEKWLLQNDESGVIKRLRENGQEWAIPLWSRKIRESVSESRAAQALEKLAGFLQDKDYFVISTLTNDLLWESGLDYKKIVTPCGGSLKKQCERCCTDVLEQTTGAEAEELWQRLQKGELSDSILGSCPKCGGRMVLNNIYARQYNENGYLEQWKAYMEWLKGTLNKNLCVLELGVGMDYPGIIRWPFEKTVYLNRSALLIRINSRLYQLSEELHGRGIPVMENAVEWLLS